MSSSELWKINVNGSGYCIFFTDEADRQTTDWLKTTGRQQRSLQPAEWLINDSAKENQSPSVPYKFHIVKQTNPQKARTTTVAQNIR